MELDLHGLEIAEAMIEIYLSLEDCKKNGDSIITFIHGFHGGQSLKNSIRSPRFLKELYKHGYQLKKSDYKDPGKTTFLIL